jgi:nitroreductase
LYHLFAFSDDIPYNLIENNYQLQHLSQEENVMIELKKQTELAKLIRERRSVKKGYNNKKVTEETVLQLLNDAVWAPTHGLRQPWRFIFIDSEQKPDFAKKVAATYPEFKQKNRENYLNEPNAILTVIMEEPEIQKAWEENYGATASMIQNLWLLAWEQQLGMVWKTNPHIYDPKVKEILNVKETEKIVGFIHMGYFDVAPAKKERISVNEKFSTYQA